MHKYKVLIFGPRSFINTIDELKPFLKFIQLNDPLTVDYDIILFHQDALKDAKLKDHIHNSDSKQHLDSIYFPDL